MFVVVDGLWSLECKQINRDLFSQCTKSAAPGTLSWLRRQIYTTINTKHIIQNSKALLYN